jgi:hypothetical protein
VHATSASEGSGASSGPASIGANIAGDEPRASRCSARPRTHHRSLRTGRMALFPSRRPSAMTMPCRGRLTRIRVVRAASDLASDAHPPTRRVQSTSCTLEETRCKVRCADRVGGSCRIAYDGLPMDRERRRDPRRPAHARPTRLQSRRPADAGASPGSCDT